MNPVYHALSSARRPSKTSKRDNTKVRFVGENMNLEKPYRRLTDYPKEEDVRPLGVLLLSGRMNS
jgi:hypothetical protein